MLGGGTFLHAKPMLALAATLRVASDPVAAVGASAPVLANQAATAAGIFHNVRLPAAVLAGAGIGQLWAQIDTENARILTGAQAQSTYTKLVAITVCCEVC